MEERDTELPVATLRPRGWRHVAAARGALARWVRARLRLLEGRHAPLLLTGIFFSGMMVAMGYLADRAQRAAEGIDQARRAAALERARQDADREAAALGTTPRDPWRAALLECDHPQALFYVAQ